MLTLITIILSSSVLAALFTSLTNLYLKRKELYVQIKLEEKNKWITDIDNGIKQYTSKVTDYNNDLMRFSKNEIDRNNIANKLILCKKAHNNLIFYIYQAEYNIERIEEIESVMEEVTDTINIQRENVIKFKNNEISYGELSDAMGISEKEIGGKTYEISEKLGVLIRLEKMELTNVALSNIIKKITAKVLK